MVYILDDNELDTDFWVFTEECCKCGKNNYGNAIVYQHQHQVTMNCLDWNTWTWICSDCQKKDVVYFLPHETDFLCVGIL